MDLDAPLNLLVAWLLYPALVVAISFGVGALLERVANQSLGIAVLPAGFVSVIVVQSSLLQAGVPADLLSGLIAVLAGLGLAIRFADPRESQPSLGAVLRRPPTRAVFAYGAALVVYLIAIAPLIAQGRLGILGYNLLNDAAWHTALIEWLHAHGANAAATSNSSYEQISLQLDQGYPLGTYSWPLIGISLTGASAFALWAPTCALVLGMLAIAIHPVALASGATVRWAAALAIAIAAGFLPVSYAMQGGLKELIFMLTLFVAVLASTTIEFERETGLIDKWRASAFALVAISSMIVVFGPAAALWIVPLALFVIIALLRERPSRISGRQLLGLAALGAGSIAALALPAVIDALRFSGTVASVAGSGVQIGNLLGRVPPWEALNAWISPDYREQSPAPGLAIWVYPLTLAAAALAVIGTVREFRAGRMFIPAAVFAGVLAAAYVDLRYNHYFAAKALVAFAPIAGAATAAGLIGVVRSSGRSRKIGLALAAAFTVTFVIANGVIYTRAVVTPGDRFEELIAINERIDGKGPTLINEREEYSQVLLRDGQPWYVFGLFPPGWGLRPGYAPGQEVALDIDGYTEEHMRNFKLILERKQPGGSRPPAEFDRWFDTEHYVVWRRTADGSALSQLPVGLGSAEGVAALNCADPSIDAALDSAEKEGQSVLVAKRSAPSTFVAADEILQDPKWSAREPTGHIYRLSNQGGALTVKLKPGQRHLLMIQGAVSAGFVVVVNGKTIGTATEDFQTRDQWLPVGEFVAGSGDDVSFVPLSEWFLQPGSLQKDAIRSIAFVPIPVSDSIERVTPTQARKLCDQQVDWIAIVP